MSLDVLADILTRYGAVATVQHGLPPFCAVYILGNEGPMLAIQTALSNAGYGFSSWEAPEVYRGMLVDESVSQVPQLPQLVIPGASTLLAPVKTPKDYVMSQAAAFLHWLLTPNVYGLITPRNNSNPQLIIP